MCLWHFLSSVLYPVSFSRLQRLQIKIRLLVFYLCWEAASFSDFWREPIPAEFKSEVFYTSLILFGLGTVLPPVVLLPRQWQKRLVWLSPVWDWRYRCNSYWGANGQQRFWLWLWCKFDTVYLCHQVSHPSHEPTCTEVEGNATTCR